MTWSGSKYSGGRRVPSTARTRPVARSISSPGNRLWRPADKSASRPAIFPDARLMRHSRRRWSRTSWASASRGPGARPMAGSRTARPASMTVMRWTSMVCARHSSGNRRMPSKSYFARRRVARMQSTTEFSRSISRRKASGRAYMVCTVCSGLPARRTIRATASTFSNSTPIRMKGARPRMTPSRSRSTGI